MQGAVMNQPVLTPESYRENQVNTANREEMILMLYEGGMRFIQQGIAALDEKDHARLCWSLLRAQKIVHYLDLCLDFEAGQQVARNLSALYGFVNHRLTEALIKKTVQPLQEAAGVLATLRGAWQEGVIRT